MTGVSTSTYNGSDLLLPFFKTKNWAVVLSLYLSLDLNTYIYLYWSIYVFDISILIDQ